jgi:hypothetical protein
MSSLLNLGERRLGYINLYENDYYGYQKTIKTINLERSKIKLSKAQE